MNEELTDDVNVWEYISTTVVITDWNDTPLEDLESFIYVEVEDEAS